MTLMVEMMISMMRIMATARSASRAGPCLPCVQLGELSQLNYGGDDGDGEDDDIDGEDDDCARRVEPVWRADKCRSSRAPPDFEIVIMCNITGLLVFGTLVFDTIFNFSYIIFGQKQSSSLC